MSNPQKLTIMQNNLPITIDLSISWEIPNNIHYPIIIQNTYLGDVLPIETGGCSINNNPAPKTCTYGYNQTEDGDKFTIENRYQVYELIRDISNAITQELTQPDHSIYTPSDDTTFDISNAIDLLHLLDQIGTL